MNISIAVRLLFARLSCRDAESRLDWLLEERRQAALDLRDIDKCIAIVESQAARARAALKVEEIKEAKA